MTPDPHRVFSWPVNTQRIAWLGFFALILWAWWWLYMMATGMGMSATGGPVMGGMPGMDMADLPGVETGSGMDAMPNADGMPAMGGMQSGDGMAGMGDMSGMTSVAVLVPMWVIMMAAMMGPTFVPTARTYEDLIMTGAGTRAGFLGLVAGYLAIWFGFGAGIGLVHAWFADLGLIGGMGQSASVTLSVIILAAAGVYQFTSAKDRCLAYCRSPMVHFLAHWHPGPAGGARMGARIGVWCVACCWAIMMIGFVGGTMNIVWMGIATLLMTLEKLPDIGEWLTRPLGVLFLGAAGLTAMGLI